jgi:hypothetical protein
MAHRGIRTIGCLAALGGALSFGLSTSAGAATSPSKLLAKAIADAGHGSWVHEVTTSKGDGHTLGMVNDIGTSNGRQDITIDGDHGEVILLNHTAYISGQVKTLENYFGVPTKDATKLKGKWLSVPSSDAEYSVISAALTLASDFKDTDISGPFKEGTSVTVAGQKAIPISGFIQGSSTSAKIAATMYISTGGTPLPLKIVASNKTVSTTTTWSSWGHSVSLKAPSNPVKAASLGL